jgi:hypothetical protein
MAPRTPDRIVPDRPVSDRPVSDRPLRRPSRRAFWVTAVLAIVCGGIIWLLVFDLWLGQVERQYLWEQARHELKLGPRVSLKGMMNHAVGQAAWIASAWALMVAAAIIGAGFYGYHEGKRAAHASRSRDGD